MSHSAMSMPAIAAMICGRAPRGSGGGFWRWLRRPFNRPPPGGDGPRNLGE